MFRHGFMTFDFEQKSIERQIAEKNEFLMPIFDD